MPRIRWLFLCLSAALGAALFMSHPAHAEDILVLTYPQVPPYASVLAGLQDATRSPVRVQEIPDPPQGPLPSAGKPRVVVAVGPDATHMALESYPETPLVATYILDDTTVVGDRSALTVVISLQADPLLTLGVARDLMPTLRRVGVLCNRRTPLAILERAKEAAASLGIQLNVVQAAGPGDVLRALPSLLENVDVYWWLPDPDLFPAPVQKFLLEASYKSHVPIIGYTDKTTREGAFFSVGVDNTALGEHIARVIDAIMEGTLKGSMHFVYSEAPRITVNRHVLERFGLSMPEALKGKIAKFYGEE